MIAICVVPDQLLFIRSLAVFAVETDHIDLSGGLDQVLSVSPSNLCLQN